MYLKSAWGERKKLQKETQIMYNRQSNEESSMPKSKYYDSSCTFSFLLIMVTDLVKREKDKNALAHDLITGECTDYP